jgi:WXG100 family type VII secretion target
VNRYSIDLDELLAFVGRLEKFNDRAEDIASTVDREVAQLHSAWSGLGADAEKQYHQTWTRLATEMREAANRLHHYAQDAHRNYTDVAVLNSSMWP